MILFKLLFLLHNNKIQWIRINSLKKSILRLWLLPNYQLIRWWFSSISFDFRKPGSKQRGKKKKNLVQLMTSCPFRRRVTATPLDAVDAVDEPMACSSSFVADLLEIPSFDLSLYPTTMYVHVYSSICLLIGAAYALCGCRLMNGQPAHCPWSINTGIVAWSFSSFFF